MVDGEACSSGLPMVAMLGRERDTVSSLRSVLVKKRIGVSGWRSGGEIEHDISKIERGVANPSVGTLERISDALGGDLKVVIA